MCRSSRPSCRTVQPLVSALARIMAAYVHDPRRERRAVGAVQRLGRSGHRGQHGIRQVVYQGHQEVARPHRRVADAEVEHGICGVRGAQRRRILPGGGLRRETLPALLHQRFNRTAQDQGDQLLPCVERAAGLAGIGRRLQGDTGRRGFYHVMLKQLFVDAAQVLDGQVTVVDPPASGARLHLPRHLVHDGDQFGVRHLGPGQYVSCVVLKQANVIGGQAKAGVAQGDRPGQVSQPVPALRRMGREWHVVVPEFGCLLPQPVQAVIAVSGMAYRQQVAVFGVKQEQQPVEQADRALARLRAPVSACSVNLWVMPGEGADQVGEDTVEHGRRQLFRDPCLIGAALAHGVIEEVGVRGSLRLERLAAEQQQEHAHPVVRRRTRRDRHRGKRRRLQQVRQVDADEALRPGARTAEIQPPYAAVRQQAPAQRPVRLHIGARHIAQYLRGGRLAPSRCAVQRGQPRLVLHDHRAMGKAPQWRQRPRRVLGGRGQEQERIGNVPAAAVRDGLHQPFPAQLAQPRVDELVFRLRFAGRGHDGKLPPLPCEADARRFDGACVKGLVCLGLADAIPQVVLCEQAARDHAAPPNRADGRGVVGAYSSKPKAIPFAGDLPIPLSRRPMRRMQPSSGRRLPTSAGSGCALPRHTPCKQA